MWFVSSKSKTYSDVNIIKMHIQKTQEEYEMVGMIDEVGGVENPSRVCIKAGLMLLLGTVIAAAFADPLVDTVTNLSNATKIPFFFIPFIVIPLLTNAGDAINAITSARRKKKKDTSLTFSEVS